MLRRAEPGQVEVHTKETDIFYIVDGTATFVTGGTIVGQGTTRPNQLTGADIDGGQMHQLKKGDFIDDPGRHPSLVQGRAASGDQLLHGEGGAAVVMPLAPR